MSEIKALEKLRKLTICDRGEKHTAYLDAGDIADEIEAEIAERFMELPVDADGVPIKPGDIMQFRDDAPVRVDSIGNSKCYVGDFGWFGGNGGFYGKGTLKCCRHVKPRTLEDVLRDVVSLCANTWKDEKSAFRYYDVGNVMESGNIADFAAEIRELMGAES